MKAGGLTSVHGEALPAQVGYQLPRRRVPPTIAATAGAGIASYAIPISGVLVGIVPTTQTGNLGTNSHCPQAYMR